MTSSDPARPTTSEPTATATTAAGEGGAPATAQEMPAGHVGPVRLSGTGRTVWWTGRVAIGLRYEPPQAADATAGAVTTDVGAAAPRVRPAERGR